MTDTKPLSQAEREFIQNHPGLSATDLAIALGRKQSEITGLLAAAVNQGTKFTQIARTTVYREGKRVGAIMTPQASAAMDSKEVRAANKPAGPPPVHPSPEGKVTDCIFKPLGDV